jgi:hypothetical protein
LITVADLTYRVPAEETLAALLARSNRLGGDPRNTNYAGQAPDLYAAYLASGYGEKISSERTGGTPAGWGA